MTSVDRRNFIRNSALASGALLAPSVLGLISCTEPTSPGGTPLRQAGRGKGGYGGLRPSKDVGGTISIPAGFHAALLSTAGDQMVGGIVPNAFDGMAAFAAGAGLVRLVRNHELRDVPASNPSPFGGTRTTPSDRPEIPPSKCEYGPTVRPRW
jgi:uncharacterized protein